MVDPNLVMMQQAHLQERQRRQHEHELLKAAMDIHLANERDALQQAHHRRLANLWMGQEDDSGYDDILRRNGLEPQDLEQAEEQQLHEPAGAEMAAPQHAHGMADGGNLPSRKSGKVKVLKRRRRKIQDFTKHNRGGPVYY
jgi:hypothetical protein